jgi:hypothetical protein
MVDVKKWQPTQPRECEHASPLSPSPNLYLFLSKPLVSGMVSGMFSTFLSSYFPWVSAPESWGPQNNSKIGVRKEGRLQIDTNSHSGEYLH